MNRPYIALPLAIAAITCVWQAIAAADQFQLDCSRPACGKVCKLVCETKKLSATCYGCECKDICLPEPSREGCKHCSECFGKCPDQACGECQAHQPKCEFCWRDWFACGYAQPRTVHVLTKYQAEKNICWYHWEVVDATCSDCVTKNGNPGTAGKSSAAQARRTFYKPAPENAQLGDVIPITEDEWVKLAALLTPDPTEVTATASSTAAKPAAKTTAMIKPLEPPVKTPSLADRLHLNFKK